MHTDIRETELYRQAEQLFTVLRRPGSGLISDALEVSTNGTEAVFSGSLVDRLDGAAPLRIGCVSLATGHMRVLTFGPNSDRSPKFAPDGNRVAFLSDRHREGDSQLYILDPISGAVGSTPPVEGWVEYLQWSPDGKRILLGVAGHGADIAGGHGAITTQRLPTRPSWMPLVDTGKEEFRWRRAWIYELDSDRVRQVSPIDCNIWEATWCGNDAIAVVASPGPGEGLWYGARLHVIEIDKGTSREVYAPRDQLGWPAATPSGHRLAIVEALSSDRWIVAGDLKVLDTMSGAIEPVDTHGIDVTYTEWRSDRFLLLAGHRNLETAVALYDAVSRELKEVWRSQDITGAGRYVSVSGFGESGDCVLIGEGYRRAPEIAVLRAGKYRALKSLDPEYPQVTSVIDKIESVSWAAADGLALSGWLLRPKGDGPHPLILYLHGGPTGHWRPSWLGRFWSVPVLMLLALGYAVFFPNPRGSSGRGQEFARHVLGEMGGADAQDCLAGVDHLVHHAIADPHRLGVMGASYGGYLTAWLITQDSRFGAAVSVAPVTNQVTWHLVSNIPDFVSLFLADHYTNAGGKYFTRSPIMHVRQARTPTLNICGALDRCTPPEEAVQFHNALLENGVESVLVTYPEEGHGVRKWPAAIDYAARTVGWFEDHLRSPHR